MVEPLTAPISHVDIDRLYVDGWTPRSWADLEQRTVQLLERGVLGEQQARTIVTALRTLAEEGRSLPLDPGELYLMIRPVLERMPGGYG